MPDVRRIVTDIVPKAGESAALVAEISAWEDPPRAAPTELAPVLSMNGFAGPLDWLLEMAQARKIDLARLSIVALIEAFATAMEAALARQIDGRATELERLVGHGGEPGLPPLAVVAAERLV
jgi:hypothetical protein